MRFLTVSAYDHFHSASFTQKILQKHAIHINRPKIILQYADTLTYFKKMSCIMPYKGCLSGTQKPGYKIYFYHLFSVYDTMTPSPNVRPQVSFISLFLTYLNE